MLEDPKQAPVFLVVDALDECPISRGILTPRAQVLDIVKVLVELKLPHLHFCITSRPEFDIRAVFDPLEPSSVSLHDQEGQIEDIAQYVKSVVSSDVTMREWPKEEKKLVIDTLAKNGGGMCVTIVVCDPHRFLIRWLSGSGGHSASWRPCAGVPCRRSRPR
jgi:hypothetical protein